MFKLFGLLIGLFIVYNTFSSSTFSDVEKTMNVASKTNVNVGEIKSTLTEFKGLMKEYDNLDNNMDELARIDYIIGNNIVSYKQLATYFSLKIQKLNTSGTKVLLFLSYTFLFVALVSFALALALFVAFLVKIIMTKNRREYLKEKTQAFLVRLGSFSCGFVFFLIAFLRVLNA